MSNSQTTKIEKRLEMAKHLRDLANELRSPIPKIDLGHAFANLAEGLSVLLEELP